MNFHASPILAYAPNACARKWASNTRAKFLKGGSAAFALEFRRE
jgi:hypothetical protein